jgi:hypothetical protein
LIPFPFRDTGGAYGARSPLPTRFARLPLGSYEAR